MPTGPRPWWKLAREESDALLGYLYRHLQRPRFQVRFHWQDGSEAFWDNRAVQHDAMPDYCERQMMQRVTITGERPYDPGG